MMKQSLDPAVPVLLTRPMEQGQAFARRLVERFGARVQPLLSPLMALHPLAPDLPKGDFSAVIFTSSTGISSSHPLRVDLPARAYCVGRKTAEAAQAAGFQAISANGDADALLSLILADPPKGRLLHLRGEEARGNLAERLSAAGVPTVDLVVYRQDPQPLTDEAIALLQAAGPVILPLFSPRSGALMAKALHAGMQAQLYLAALSPAVTEAASGIPRIALVTAKRPDADAMLDVIATLIVAAPPP